MSFVIIQGNKVIWAIRLLVVFVLLAVSSCSSQTERFESERMLQDEILIRQKMELERQEREYEDIQRQQYHNRVIEPYTR